MARANSTGSKDSTAHLGFEERRALIEADLVDCMVALPGQLFYSTQIPGCLKSIEKNGNASAKHSAFKTAQM